MTLAVGFLQYAKEGSQVWLLDIDNIEPNTFELKTIDQIRYGLVIGDRIFDRRSGYELDKHHIVASRIFGEHEKNAYQMVHVHQEKIAEMVRTCKDITALTHIAQILNYRY